jgi:hypothetical protein
MQFNFTRCERAAIGLRAPLMSLTGLRTNGGARA